jgi:pyruvate/2-oxoglutarate dehydrogenase complex dihydrolipoamide dehydrogenase (E3) component
VVNAASSLYVTAKREYDAAIARIEKSGFDARVREVVGIDKKYIVSAAEIMAPSRMAKATLEALECRVNKLVKDYKSLVGIKENKKLAKQKKITFTWGFGRKNAKKTIQVNKLKEEYTKAKKELNAAALDLEKDIRKVIPGYKIIDKVILEEFGEIELKANEQAANEKK